MPAPAKSASAVPSLRSDWLLPIAAVGIVFVMLVPVPAILLDVLLAVSITLSVLVLLAALQILRPVQFSVFPTLLLLLTLYRLSLNLASTRRILLHGNEGTAAAGQDANNRIALPNIQKSDSKSVDQDEMPSSIAGSAWTVCDELF